MSEGVEIDFENQVEALGQLEATKREKDELLVQRQENLPASVINLRKKHQSNKSSLKSDLKKTTAFVKKLKSVNAEGLLQCIKDAESLNLALYISEIVNAIMETTFKATDVPSMIKLCVCLHQRYEEFTSALLSSLQSTLLSVPAEDDKDAGKKRRIQIRFALELFQAGVSNDDAFFTELLSFLLGKSKMNATGAKPGVDLMSIQTFVKYGGEILLGYPSKRIQAVARAAGVPESNIPALLLTQPSVRNDMRAMIAELFGQLCKKLVDAHRDYRSKEKKMEKDRQLHGCITEQKQQELENSKRLFEKFHSVVLTLSESTGEEVPVLEEDKEEDDGTKKLTVWEGNAAASDFGPYGDAETRAFYEDLPDLLSLVPLTALGISIEQANALREQWKLSKDNSYLAGENDESQDVELSDVVTSAEEVETTEISGDVLCDGPEEPPRADENSASTNSSTPAAVASESSAPKEDTVQSRVAALLEKLPECVNKQRADEFAVGYAHYNGKGARKKLIEALSRIPRNRSELAPNYARIVAAMSRVFPDIGTAVVDSVRAEFFAQMKHSKVVTQYIDHRVRTLKYAAELVKFGVTPPILAFKLFKALLNDFTYHNIELVTVLLEACGRFLYLLPFTHDRLEEVLETMLRLRRAKNLDMRQQNLVEAAYFAVKPPERSARQKKVLSTVQQYAQYLILQRLDSPGVVVDNVIESLRRLPWNNSEDNLEEVVVRAVLKLARKKYVSIGLLADCMSGLSRSCPNLLVRLIDRVLEEIQHGLDNPLKREPQRMLGMIRLLGELYNYAVVSSPVIFEMLYHLINFGHDVPLTLSGLFPSSAAFSSPSSLQLPPEIAATLSPGFDPRIQSELDPLNDLFRAQLVCELLNTCGSYYVRGQARVKLSRFLVYFQRYLLVKPSLPMHVEFSILDTMDSLEDQARAALNERPSSGDVALQGLVFPRFDSMESVQQAVQAIEAKPEALVMAEEEEAEEEERRREEREKEGRSVPGNESAVVNNNDEASDDDSDDSGEGDGSDDDEEDDDSEGSSSTDGDEEGEDATSSILVRAAEEDEEFEKAFKACMQESVEAVKSTSGAVKGISLNRMAIPAVLPKLKNASMEVDEDESDRPHKVMPFKLLSRDNKGRVEARELWIPKDTALVEKVSQSEAIRQQERQLLKERTLQIDILCEQTSVDLAEEYGATPEVVEVVPSRTIPTSLLGNEVRAMPRKDRGESKYQAPGRGIGEESQRGNDNSSTKMRATGYVAYGSYGERPRNNSGQSGKRGSNVRAQETRRPANSLNFEELLAEQHASEIRRLQR